MGGLKINILFTKVSVIVINLPFASKGCDFVCLKNYLNFNLIWYGSRGDAIVSIRASHRCDPGSIPAWGMKIMWGELFIGRSQPDTEGVLWALWFSSLLKIDSTNIN